MADSYPLALFTGKPGTGKTASLVKRIVDLQKQEPGRPVFQMGINGLAPGLAMDLTLDQLHKWWEELPRASIVCLDECQEDHLLPKDRGNPAEWVKMLAKARHFGFSFLMTTQHPANMSAFVRRLVGLHVHSAIRAKGVRQTFTWEGCVDDPESRSARKQAEMSFSPLPKEVFELYKSSSMHTMKVRTPRRVYMLAALIVGGVASVALVVHRVHGQIHDGKAQLASTPGLGGTVKSETLRETNFIKWSTPRVAGIPWSAPMFDKLEVKAEPKLYCIAGEDGRCLCNTEQGTRYEVPVKQCRAVVDDGLYNPFLVPPERDGSGSDKEQTPSPASRQEAASPPAGKRGEASEGDAVASSGEWKDSPMRSAYAPPELARRPDYQPHTLD